MVSRFARIMQKHKARINERLHRTEIGLLLMTLANEQLKKANELSEYRPVKRKRKVTKQRKRTNA